MDHNPPGLIAPFEPLSFSASAFRLRQFFPTPVLMAPVNDAERLNAALRITIITRAALTQGVIRSNDGGWQSEDDFEDWSGPAGETLLEGARQLVNRFTGIETSGGLLRDHAPDWRVNAWANVNGAGDANAPHHHPGSYWSGVYWVDTGDIGPEGANEMGGEFEMQDPRGILPNLYAPQLKMAVPGCLSAGLSDFITPQAGMMLIFPSWLVHAVRRYRGASPRISVAFNFGL